MKTKVKWCGIGMIIPHLDKEVREFYPLEPQYSWTTIDEWVMAWGTWHAESTLYYQVIDEEEDI